MAFAMLCSSPSAFGQAGGSTDPLLGLPVISGTQPPVAVVALGRKLFFDARLSADRKISCGSCHLPNLGFTDGRARSLGHEGQSTTRNAPSLINVAYLSTLFWDGRVRDLETQARAPLTNPVEHALANEAALETLVRQDLQYARDFSAAFNILPDGISADHVAQALAAYERTLRAGRSPFDRYQYGGETTALSAAAIRGLELFRGRAQCASCHTIGATAALFTDESFHVAPTGLPKSVTTNLGALARKVLDARDSSAGKAQLEFLIATDTDVAALGRFVVTQDPRDIGTFKTPTLRNVALTAPYMHDGSVETLEKAVDLELYGRGKEVRYPIVLTVAEKLDLVQLLQALTSQEVNL